MKFNIHLLNVWAVTFLSTLIFENASAQFHFAQSSSQWIFRISSAGGTSIDAVHHFKVEKDTAIENISCLKITENDSVNYYSYEQNDSVFFYLNGVFRPMMFFNVSVGDSVKLYDENQYSLTPGSPYLTIVIYDVQKRALSDGDSVNQYSFWFPPSINPEWVGQSMMSSSYTEKLGANNYLFPKSRLGDWEMLEELCNYGDSSLNNYWMYPNKDCSTPPITGIHSVSNSKNLKISPNPTNTVLFVEDEENALKNSVYLIKSLTGQVIYSTRDKEINVSLLDKGAYILSVLLPTGQVDNIQFVKE